MRPQTGQKDPTGPPSNVSATPTPAFNPNAIPALRLMVKLPPQPQSKPQPHRTASPNLATSNSTDYIVIPLSGLHAGGGRIKGCVRPPPVCRSPRGCSCSGPDPQANKFFILL
ncbi:hypothetical protein Vafri_8686 [Volvox africanus]|uniref:Uncharacterized protein n=1 Tax=Volvox africanus TaxID=51714 RepID=A0A8J4B7C2_9CHLO|nr:hypothetical protein Vafri_8686 [Volvox africanus]